MQHRDLQLLLQGKSSLVIVETFDESKALELLIAFFRSDPAPLYQWTLTEGIRRTGLSIVAPEEESPTAELEKALLHIKSQSTASVYVLCDAHHFIDEPKVIRLIKDILFSPFPAHKLILLSHAITLPAELSRHAVTIPVAVPNDDEIMHLIREEAEVWAQANGRARIKVDKSALDALVNSLRGLPHMDVRRLVHGAIADDGAITPNDVPNVNKAKFELMDMEGVLHFEYNTAKLSEVAGLKQFKKWLNERREAFFKAENDIPKGVLLLGVQGGGKSLAAKAVAGVWGVPLLRLDMGQLFNKYIGETERNLRQALALADTLSPCVLWVDELEKGLAESNAEGGLSKRILGTLLTWMSERQSRVFIVATSNNIQQLPAELLRKGRFDEIFFVDLPNKSTRMHIFKIHLQKRQLKPEEYDLNALADSSEGFTGAEIEQAVVSAVYSASARKRPTDTAMIVSALRNTRPLSVVMAEPMNALRQWADERAVSAD